MIMIQCQIIPSLACLLFVNSSNPRLLQITLVEQRQRTSIDLYHFICKSSSFCFPKPNHTLDNNPSSSKHFSHVNKPQPTHTHHNTHHTFYYVLLYY
ncbi:hypothetical protein F4703DRAFT_1861401 [Phycomyces blakesleeanus]